MNCRLCGSHNNYQVLSLGSQALNSRFPKPGEDVEKSPLELIRCYECELVQLKESTDPKKLFGDEYGYRSGLNPSMVSHLQAIVKEIEESVPFASKDIVVDIGSSDATLLKAYKTNHIRRIGIDPSAQSMKEFYPKDIELIPEFFGNQLKPNSVSIVTSISMFYDLEDPLGFAKKVYAALKDKGVWVLEQSYLPHMIENLSYDTITHEHLEYYGLKQIKIICDSVGFTIIAVSLNDANGGSFRVTAQKGTAFEYDFLERMVENENAIDLEGFANRVATHKEMVQSFFYWMNKLGKKVIGYGASTKGNVVLQHCELTQKEIPFFCDVNERKWGRVTPGSGIPIISEDRAKVLDPDYFWVGPWHFKNMILEKEKNLRTRFIFPLPEFCVV